MKEVGIGPTALADMIGTTKQNIDRWRQQKQKIPVDWAEKIASRFDRLTAEIMLPPDTLVGLNRVPVLSIVRAGKMSLDEIRDAEIGTIIATGLPKGDWAAFKVDGNSMNKISPPDSIIFVNRRDKKLAPNGLYVVTDHEGKASYKRFRPDPPRFVPVSTMDDEETIYPNENTTVYGRVRRTMLDM